MEDLDYELRYELLPTEPPEKRPLATKAFQDFRVLVLNTALGKATLRFARRGRGTRTTKL